MSKTSLLSNGDSDNKVDFKGLMPDDDDRKNIVEYIKTYDTAFPYPHVESIGRCIEEALEEIDNRPKDKTGMVKRMSLPQPFVINLTKAYPDLFTDQAKCEWFLKNFPTFDLTR